MVSQSNINNKPINYKKHLLVILPLLVYQFFIADISSFIYLKYAESKYLEKNGKEGVLYYRGEYSPISSEIAIQNPLNYKFVFVKSFDRFIYEIYFKKSGERNIVRYDNNKWSSTSSSNFAVTIPFFLLPLVGFGLCMISILHQSVRIGSIWTWDLMKHNLDNTEKICLLYGIPLFLSGILFGFRTM